jgi:hypothetical protein
MTTTFDPEKHVYKRDGKRLTSVTTILSGGIPKPQLVNWAARVAAQYAVDNPGATFEEIKDAHTRDRDTAAVRGTAVHDIAEKLVHGEAVEVPEELEPYIDGYLAFLDAFQITPVLTEKTVVLVDLGVAGRFDLIATSPHLNNGEPVMIDLKTSRGVYGETGLQCAAYSSADYYVTDKDPEHEHKLPGIAATYVAHVQPSGTYLHPLATGPVQISRQFDMFKAAHFIYRTTTERGKIVGHPIEYPDQAAA